MNPYAAPVAGGHAHTGAPGAAGQDFWREGELLVVRKGTHLPDVCLATGQPTGGNVKTKTLQWMPPWIGVVFVLSWPIGLILMLILRKKGQLTYFLSQQAEEKRKKGIMIGIGLIIAFFASVGIGIALEAPFAAVVGTLLFIVGLIVAIVYGAPFRVHKIDNEVIYLKMKPEFWPGSGL